MIRTVVVPDNTVLQVVLPKKYQCSFYDSLIIFAALENDYTIHYSEDLHHSQLIGNKLKIVNPFL